MPHMGWTPAWRPAAGCHQVMPRHVPMCDTSTNVADVVWRGREAIRYGLLPTAEGVPARCPTWHGLPAPPRTLLDADCPVTMARHVSVYNKSVRGFGATRGSLGADCCDPLTHCAGGPSQVPHLAWAPPRTLLDADCPVTMARHVSLYSKSLRVVGATESGRRADCRPGTGGGGAGAPCRSG